MPFAAVHEDDVRQNGELVVAAEHAQKPPRQDLAHRGVIILPFHGPHAELPIALFVGFESIVNHHGADGIDAVGVGDIVGFRPKLAPVIGAIFRAHLTQHIPDLAAQCFPAFGCCFCFSIDGFGQHRCIV